MFLTSCAVLVSFCVFGLLPATAAEPDPGSIIKQMKAALEPDRSGVRTITVTLRDGNEQQARWTALKAIKTLPEGKRTLLVLLAPDMVQGSALLIGEREADPDMMWTYTPATRRVRQIVPVDAYDDFLGTDFRLADLGFVSRQGTYIFRGEEEHMGKQAYKISFVPHLPIYYSRIFTWVDAESLLPLQRDYYDLDAKLRKTERFEKVTVINGIPTPLLITMNDVQDGTSTEFRVSEVRHDVELPDTLFTAKELGQAVRFPVWQDQIERLTLGRGGPS